MPRSHSYVAQIWECPKCGKKQECPIPAIEVQCSAKHPHVKMKLIFDEKKGTGE